MAENENDKPAGVDDGNHVDAEVVNVQEPKVVEPLLSDSDTQIELAAGKTEVRPVKKDEDGE